MTENRGIYVREIAQTPAKGGDGKHDDTFNIKRYLHILVIHRWKLLILLFLVLTLSFVYASNQQEYFQASYEIYYSESAQQFVEDSDVPVLKSYFDSNYWLSVMRSNEIARLTAENSGLPLEASKVRGMFRVEMHEQRYWWLPVRYVVTITSEDNEKIPVLFKAYVQSLNDMLVNHQVEFSKGLTQHLTNQLNDNYNRLNKIDREILMYQATSPFQVRDMDRLASDLESFRNRLQQTRIDLAAIRASKQRTEEELKNIDPTIFNELAYSEPLKVQMMNLQVELARALTRHQEDHPRVRAIRENINQLNNMLRDDIEQTTEIKSLTQNPLQSQLMSKLLDFQINEIAAETRLNSLQQVIREIEERMLPDTTDMEQHQLARNRELVFSTIDKLNSKIIDIQSAAHGGLHKFLYVDEPRIPTTPANKSMTYFLLVGLLLGLGLGIGGVYVYDFLDNRIMLLSDFETFYQKIPILGTLPHKKKAEEYFLSLDNDYASYRHKSETNEIIFFTSQLIKRKYRKVISICSPLRGEGKSVVSLQLAAGLAEKKMKVLLVDLDIFAPKLTQKLHQNGYTKKQGPQIGHKTIQISDLVKNIVGDKGLMDYMYGNASLSEITLETEIPTLEFISVGKTRGINDLGFDEDRFKSFMTYARENYDVVVFDTPAMMFLPNLADLMEQVDMIVPVARLRHSTRLMFDKILKMLSPYHEKVAGVVVNDVRAIKLGRYGGEYDYYSYYKEIKDQVEKQAGKRVAVY